MNSGAETSQNSVMTNGGWLNAQLARHVVKITESTSMGYSTEAAERCGNSRQVSGLTRLLSGKRHTRSINPSKDLNGDLLVTQDQLLDEWSKFRGAKFSSPDVYKNRSLECLTAEDDELGDEELHKCLEALRCGKATGCDNVPVEAYRGSVEATKELFRICRLMWHTERIPPELVRGMFVMLHKKGSRDDYRNY